MAQRTPEETEALTTSLEARRQAHLGDAAYYRGRAADADEADVRAAYEREATDAHGRAARRARNIADVRAGRD
ncbi:hypothetical protein FF36_05996 [Frankia torreyi]|uniref:Uncharacterized protein n=1 Tax=Frankia torreyi TaxID=1856 RepID=A0A0D8B6F4_9ACTN|nr:hypothetical protein [Frankia torreyi]KJE19741.1 hypothetical protein FF36_05996 [Frankia torreyi]